MTFKERRKRADAQLIASDFERLESSFLSYTQKLNKKRQAQMMKRIDKLIPELMRAHEKGDKEEVEGILKTLTMPSSKEWLKGIEKLVLSSAESGILRAHLEILKLKEFFEFDDSWVEGYGYGFEVVIPEEARDFIKKHSYSVGVITEDTVLNRLRIELENSMDEGMTPKELRDRVKQTAGTWMSDQHATTIARTETGKFYNAGRIARWTDPDLDGFVEALQYDAIIDGRQTDICNHLDGKIIPIGDDATIARYTPPNHFQCRATWLPISKYEEWENDWDSTVVPEKGFNSDTTLPNLLKGQKEPLVRVNPSIDPQYIVQPDVIRTLDDESFKIAIKNVTDKDLKLEMVLERADEMIKKELQFDLTERPYSYNIKGLNNGKFTFELRGETFVGDYMRQDHNDLYYLHEKLNVAKSAREFNMAVRAFIDAHESEWSHADMIVMLKKALKANTNVERPMAGRLAKIPKSKEELKRLTVKRPPMSGGWKENVKLQNALDEGERWLKNHMDPKTFADDIIIGDKFPEIKLRFSKTNKRAFARAREGTIHFGANAYEPSVIVHEIGHVIHRNNFDITKLIDSFYNKRTAGLKQSYMYGNETTIKDDFFDAYVGRIYGHDYKGAMGAEVFSMGIQEMFHNPADFYRRDKEHFELTYAIMKGLF